MKRAILLLVENIKLHTEEPSMRAAFCIGEHGCRHRPEGVRTERQGWGRVRNILVLAGKFLLLPKYGGEGGCAEWITRSY